jgi:sugar/nucleoside kinase (ribokinase family)
MTILGIGNALLDVLIKLDDDAVLERSRLTKGAMDIIDEKTMRELQNAQSGLPRSEVPGGSVCNTMRSLAHLNATVGYIGKIGDDHAAAVYERETIKAGVSPCFIRTKGISGCSTVLISPDGERTMATYLGPAATLSADEITDEILQRYSLLYIEGYLISNEKLFLPVLERAKKAGMKLALDLSNFNIVNAYRPMLRKVIPEYINILFSNESEAEAYTGLPAREAIGEMSKDVDIAVVTVGKEGVLASDGARIIRQPASKCSVIDTTGAGDNFAAGFLYGYSQQATIEQAAQYGTLLSSHVIEVVGAQIPEDRWESIRKNIDRTRFS